MTVDMINHPPHYTQGKYETIDIIEDTTWGYRLATAFKYLHRCEYKGKKKEDLRKAVWFLLREIDSLPDDPNVITGTMAEVMQMVEDDAHELDSSRVISYCVRCEREHIVFDKNGVCIACKSSEPAIDAHPDNPYLTVRQPVSHSKQVTPPSKVILHNSSKDGLGGHTEPLSSEYWPSDSCGDRYDPTTVSLPREEYRAEYRKSFNTHLANVDQLTIEGLAQYD